MACRFAVPSEFSQGSGTPQTRASACSPADLAVRSRTGSYTHAETMMEREVCKSCTFVTAVEDGGGEVGNAQPNRPLSRASASSPRSRNSMGTQGNRGTRNAAGIPPMQSQCEINRPQRKGQPVRSRVEKRTFVEMVPTNARGWPIGVANPAARWADETVARARELHAGGLSAWKVAKSLGVANRTVRAWLDGTRRPPPARHVARLRVVDEPETPAQGRGLASEHAGETAFNAHAGAVGLHGDADIDDPIA